MNNLVKRLFSTLPSGHVPVLLEETLSCLNISNLPQDSIVVDATFGGGGHTTAFLGRKQEFNFITL